VLIADVFDVVSIAFPAIGSLLIGMALSRKLAAMNRDAVALDHRVAELTRPRAIPSLTRPTYRPRWRFPFRALRSASLWIILTALASRGHMRCTPDPQPAPAVIDCAHDRSRLAQAGCALATAVMIDMIDRLRR
jgi:hypothetical protein